MTNGELMIKTQLTEAFKEPVKSSIQADVRSGSCQASKEQVTAPAPEEQGRCQWIM